MSKIKDTGLVVSQEMISDSIYSMVVKTKLAALAKPGQFVSIYCKDSSKLLPRPISICQIDVADSTLRFVYRVVGRGTEEFSAYQAGDDIELLGPVGNGFPLDVLDPSKKVILVGGGIGVPPMVGVAEGLSQLGLPKENILSVMGYRDQDTFLEKELNQVSTVYISTDDGSKGTHGTVVDAIRANELDADFIFACGPKIMLHFLKLYAGEVAIPLYVSMEERMACGVGACLGCVCQSTAKDEHSQVNNKRVCVDGPVFLATEVEL